MAGLAGVSLVWPGTRLDAVWVLNPRAHRELPALGIWGGIGFVVLSGVLVYVAALWFRRRFRGWRLAVAIIAVQATGDAINFLGGNYVAGLIGFVIASLLLTWLLRRRVKAAFR